MKSIIKFLGINIYKSTDWCYLAHPVGFTFNNLRVSDHCQIHRWLCYISDNL